MPTNTTTQPELNGQIDQETYDTLLHRKTVAQVLVHNTRSVLETSLGQDVLPEPEEQVFDVTAQAVDATPQDGLDLGAVPGPQWDDFSAYPSFSGNQADYDLAA